jgi:predicted transcriptional regulator
MSNYETEVSLRFLTWHKKNRGRFEIIASILEAIKSKGASRYSIMKNVGSNFAEIKKYLKSLTEMGFIDMNIKDGAVLYKTNEKGLDFLSQYYVLLGKMLSSTRVEM